MIEIPTEHDWKTVCESFKKKILEKFNTPEYIDQRLGKYPFYLLFAQDNEKLNFCYEWRADVKMSYQIITRLNDWLNEVGILYYINYNFEILKGKLFLYFEKRISGSSFC